MTSRHLVDPEIAWMIDAFPPPAINENTVATLRSRQATTPDFDPSGVSLERRSIKTADGAEILLHIYLPEEPAKNRGCIYHMHGGGFVTGTAASVEFRHRPLARELGCAIVAVDYRLAPENPHPGPIEDCYAGLAWLYSEADALGIDRTRIGVMGESAGGGLAAALALLVRDRGEYPLAFQHLIYPALDDRTGTGKPHPVAGEFIWTAAHNRFAWCALLGTEPGGADVSPYAAPARASDLSGLPPAYIATGALDLLVDENIDYAQRLNRAGVLVELHVYSGGIHGFDYAPGPAIANRAIRDSQDALRRATRSPHQTPMPSGSCD
jgi:acetyl esterase/lipase